MSVQYVAGLYLEAVADCGASRLRLEQDKILLHVAQTSIALLVPLACRPHCGLKFIFQDPVACRQSCSDRMRNVG